MKYDTSARDGIRWEDLVVGEHYTAEETYQFQARDVEVIEVHVFEENDYEYVSVAFQVVEATHNAIKGRFHKWTRLTGGRLSHYIKGKFKPLGSMLDYLTPGNTPDDYKK